ncbi:MAG: YqgE/AlgH family protein [Myxococcota bacterium]
MTVSGGVSGHLLCAVPQLLDPNFERAVVLMLEHNEEGALGLVLSDAMPNRLETVLDELDVLWGGEPDAVIRKGGPVEPSRGWILHATPGWDPSCQEVLRGVWLTTSLEQVDRSLAVGQDERFLFLLGYAGWGPQQLEGEIAAGSWVAVPIGHRGVVPSSWLFEVDPADLWGKALGRMGIDPARIVGLPNRETAMH